MTVRQAFEGCDGMADGLKHFFYLSFSPLMDGDDKHRICCAFSLYPNAGRCRHFFLQHDSFFQGLQCPGGGTALHLGLIGLVDLLARMKDGLGQLTVISEKESSFSVQVKPAHGKDAFPDTVEQ